MSTVKFNVKFVVIQSGHAVFGVGETCEDAICDALAWLELDDDEHLPLVPRSMATDGDFCVLERGDPEFDNYLKNQGGYELINGEWFLECQF